jgi:hypothetical protein
MRSTDCGEIVPVPRRSTVHVDSEHAASSGNSHASFTKCVATIGRNTRGTPASRCVAQTSQLLAGESVGPLVDDPARASRLPPDG